MHIKIVGFKKHLDREFVFENNEMILLKGKSSAGKSSILQAVFWGFYGNMRDIYNNVTPIKKLSVTLSIPGITIHRKKNPELLTVTLSDGKVYHDAIAQSIIDNKYGNRELWKACSYIEQKSRCSLLSGSCAERMELLNALSFTGETPKEYISKINQKLKEVTLEFEKFQSSFLTELNIYTEEIKLVKLKSNSEELKKLKDDFLILENQLKNKNQEVLEQERLLGKYNYIQTNIKNIQNQLSEYENIQDVEIPKHLYTPIYIEKPSTPLISFSEYSKNHKMLKDKLDLIYHIISEKKRLETELSNIKIEDIYESPVITKEQIWKVKNLEKQKSDYIQECKNIGLEYNSNIIKESLIKLTEQLKNYTNYENQLDNYKKLLNLEKDIQKFEIDSNMEELEKCRNQQSLLINDLKKGLELLICPKCQTPLKYHNKSLTLAERNPVSANEISEAESEYSVIIENINKLKNKLKLQEGIEYLSKNVNKEELEEYLKIRPNLSKLSSLINKITNIKYIEIDTSSEYLNKVYIYQEKIKNKENIQKKLEILNLKNTDIDHLQTELKKLEDKYRLEQERSEKEQKQIREYQILESNRLKELNKYEIQKTNLKEKTNLLNKLDEYSEELLKIRLEPNIKNEYIDLKNLSETIKSNIEQSEYSIKIINKGIKLEEKRNKLISLQNDVQALNNLKLKSVDVECKQLEDTINNINTVLETTLPIFFDDPITLKLLLYKKVKKNDSLKPGLNLEISQKGFTCYKIESLSGGEGDRISLALMLALNFVSNSPLILLDECVSSLDGDLKEKCIEAIKLIPNKTVICIDHDDGLEGFYDSVINI